MLPSDILSLFERLLDLNLGPYGGLIGLGILAVLFFLGGWSAVRESRKEDNDDRARTFGCFGWGLVVIGAVFLGKMLFDLLAPPIALAFTLLFLEAAS